MDYTILHLSTLLPFCELGIVKAGVFLCPAINTDNEIEATEIIQKATNK